MAKDTRRVIHAIVWKVEGFEAISRCYDCLDDKALKRLGEELSASYDREVKNILTIETFTRVDWDYIRRNDCTITNKRIKRDKI